MQMDVSGMSLSALDPSVAPSALLFAGAAAGLPSGPAQQQQQDALAAATNLPGTQDAAAAAAGAAAAALPPQLAGYYRWPGASLLGCLNRFTHAEQLGAGERWTCERCEAGRAGGSVEWEGGAGVEVVRLCGVPAVRILLASCSEHPACPSLPLRILPSWPLLTPCHPRPPAHRCLSNAHAVKQLSLRHLPPLLVFHAKRFEHAGGLRAVAKKLDTYLSFPLRWVDRCWAAEGQRIVFWEAAGFNGDNTRLLVGRGPWAVGSGQGSMQVALPTATGARPGHATLHRPACRCTPLLKPCSPYLLPAVTWTCGRTWPQLCCAPASACRRRRPRPRWLPRRAELPQDSCHPRSATASSSSSSSSSGRWRARAGSGAARRLTLVEQQRGQRERLQTQANTCTICTLWSATAAASRRVGTCVGGVVGLEERAGWQAGLPLLPAACEGGQPLALSALAPAADSPLLLPLQLGITYISPFYRLLQGGHYVAYVRAADRRWYLCDDAWVTACERWGGESSVGMGWWAGSGSSRW